MGQMRHPEQILTQEKWVLEEILLSTEACMFSDYDGWGDHISVNDSRRKGAHQVCSKAFSINLSISRRLHPS